MYTTVSKSSVLVRKLDQKYPVSTTKLDDIDHETLIGTLSGNRNWIRYHVLKGTLRKRTPQLGDLIQWTSILGSIKSRSVTANLKELFMENYTHED